MPLKKKEGVKATPGEQVKAKIPSDMARRAGLID
jgi:hypothetical protein